MLLQFRIRQSGSVKLEKYRREVLDLLKLEIFLVSQREVKTEWPQFSKTV